MKVAFNDFKREYEAHSAAIKGAVERVLASGYFILGPEVKRFEEAFGKYIGSKHAIGVANGLEALQISLMALDIGPGDEVITTSLSAVATALAIRAVGATPVFADIDEYFHLDPAAIERKITSRTKAIIPVHLYGQPTDMKKILAIAKKHKLQVIEDCAQAHGAAYEGKKVGSFGCLGCFSFYPTKNLGGFGDGGAIVTDDAILAEKCRMIRNYGQKTRYEHEMYGINSRLDELQAAILSEKLKYLDIDNARRKEIAGIYRTKIGSIEEVTLPKTRAGTEHAYHLFVIEIERRDELQKYLKEKGVDALIHYPIPIHKQKCFSEYDKVKLPTTESKVGRILSLPIHPYLTDAEVEFVCAEIESFFS